MKSRFTRVTLVLLVLILCAGVVFVGCKKKETGSIKIGVGGAHTGDLASYGIPTVKAAELVVEEVNAAGGVLGRQIELVVEDDQCKEEVASNTASKLVGEGVVAVIGHICSGATESALSIYKDSEVVCVSPSATKVELTLSGNYPNFFRSIAHDEMQAALNVDFAMNTLGLKSFAIMHDKGAYGKGFAEYCREKVEAAGGSVVMFEGVDPGKPDYTAVIAKVDNSGAEALIWGGYHPEASKIVAQMRNKGIDIPFLSDDGVKDDTFIDVAGEFAEGVYATGPQDTTANPLAKKAIDAHMEKYGEEPGAFFLNAYAATMAVINAIEKAGTTDYEAVAQALRDEFVDTPLGKISFDDKGDVEGFGFSVFQVKNGAYVELK